MASKVAGRVRPSLHLSLTFLYFEKSGFVAWELLQLIVAVNWG
jgi:hypothetical protein